MTSGYIWLIISFLLMGAEILGTDYFLLFLGSAALITSIVSFVCDLSFWTEATIFGVLGLLFVIVWFVLHCKKKNDNGTKESYVPNTGLASYVGKKTKVSSVEIDGTIKVVINDTVYLAKGSSGETYQPEDVVEILGISSEERLILKKV